MSNLATHMAEQDEITAACESGTCQHDDCHPTPCERAQQIMDETAKADDQDNNTRRAARVLLAIAPSYDDDTTRQGIQDAITDLMHLCDVAGWGFAEMCDDSRSIYKMEIGELGVADDQTLSLAIKRH